MLTAMGTREFTRFAMCLAMAAPPSPGG